MTKTLASLALVVLLAGCGDPEGCSTITGSGDVCGPPEQGSALVTGHVRTAGGDAVSGVEVWVTCDDVGSYNRRTDDEGRFEIPVVHALFDPPADATSGEPFTRSCDVRVVDEASADDVAVTFYPDGHAVVPVEVELVVE